MIMSIKRIELAFYVNIVVLCKCHLDEAFDHRLISLFMASILATQMSMINYKKTHCIAKHDPIDWKFHFPNVTGFTSDKTYLYCPAAHCDQHNRFSHQTRSQSQLTVSPEE